MLFFKIFIKSFRVFQFLLKAYVFLFKVFVYFNIRVKLSIKTSKKSYNIVIV